MLHAGNDAVLSRTVEAGEILAVPADADNEVGVLLRLSLGGEQPMIMEVTFRQLGYTGRRTL